jgi:hypothetical protein
MVKIFKIMKSIRSLFMLVIGMMAFTATAHTAKLEQKQKTEYLAEVSSQAYDVCVKDYQVVSVLTDVTAEPNDIKVVQFKNVTESFNYLAIVADVGWRKSKQRFSNIQNKEKVFPGSKNDLKFTKIPLSNRIRENQFAVNQSFKFKRYC